jgi:hypothetical protein
MVKPVVVPKDRSKNMKWMPKKGACSGGCVRCGCEMMLCLCDPPIRRGRSLSGVAEPDAMSCVVAEGAGGKHTWGKLGEEYGPQPLMAGDPNYDPEETQ